MVSPSQALRRSGGSLRWRLATFAAALALPILAFVGFLLWQVASSERARVEADALAKARNMAIAVDRELGGLVASLNVLASSPALQADDLAAFYRQAAEVRSRTGYWVILRDRRTSQQIVNTRLPWGTALPKSNIPEPSEEQVRSGRPIVSDLIIGAVVKAPVVVVEVPIQRGGDFPYILSLPVAAEAVRDIVVGEEVPPNWIASVIDRAGVVVARNMRHEEFVGRSAPQEFLDNSKGGEGTWRGTSLDGQPILAAFARSRLSNWGIALGVRDADLNAPLWRSLAWFSGLGAGIVALSALLALLFGQRIAVPVRALAARAGALGRGEVVEPLSGPFRELNEVGEAMTAASLSLREREANNARLAAIVSSSSDAIVGFALDGRVLSWNKAAERLFGYSEAEAIGASAALIVPPESPDGPLGVFDRALAGRSVHQHETVRIARDGARIEVAVTAARMLADDGHVIGVSAIYHDIRERKRAEAALLESQDNLRHSEARYRAVVESATDYAIITTDLNGKVTGWNTGAENVLGWTRDEMMGQGAGLIFTPEDRAAGVPEAEMGVALAKGRSPDERWHLRKDGSRFFATGALLPKRDRSGTLLGFLKILRDRTREREIEDEVRSLNQQLEARVAERTAELSASNERLVAEAAQREKAEEQLRQSQKMEAVGRLTGGIAHDFNNLLTVITGSLDMLRRRIDGGGDARVQRLIDHATEGANRAAALTYRLLAFSRQHPLAPEPVDPNKLVAGMSDLLRRTLGENIAVETVLAGGLWRTHADPNQLENVLLNLAVNARDAMPDGGKLTIETANAHLDEDYAATRVEVTPGQYVLIAVCDTGSGMSPEVMRQAFEPFFTTKPIGKGTGLGLSQVHGFAKQSGGHVAIYSEPGHGTTVKLYLPRFKQAGETGLGQAVQVRRPEPAVVQARAGETILVVEDEAMVREFSVSALEEAGYRVLSAEDGPSGLALLDAHPEVALLFTDVVLTGPMNGRKVADEAVRRRPDLKVLFTTGYTRNAIIHHGRLDEGVDLITKPFTAASVTEKMRQVLDGRSPS